MGWWRKLLAAVVEERTKVRPPDPGPKLQQWCTGQYPACRRGTCRHLPRNKR